ncbi:MAG: General secretion pathway protein G [Berkelbacteria bacterium GW2011_GWA2_38_9]|uniref:General secretion pathway protein G n=1 Tax=Berkelbacteria bacterium GW2011_GWA2_38_9 TaxID=1618334 RepID=A0A0G0LBX8_9BACT|nr:MAG: General secretion pathway protein G [Berkelbacteria bacterium GW2011_GWA2_38_9]
MKKGFTIIELLMTLLIVGLLAASISIGVKTSQAKARDSRRLNDLKLIQTAIKSFYIDTGSYPDVNQMGGSGNRIYARSYSASASAPWLNALVSRSYLTQAPKDPIDGQSTQFINSSGGTYQNLGEYTYTKYSSTAPFPNSYKLITRLERNASAVGNDGGSSQCLVLATRLIYDSTRIYEIGEGTKWEIICPN